MTCSPNGPGTSPPFLPFEKLWAAVAKEHIFHACRHLTRGDVIVTQDAWQIAEDHWMPIFLLSGISRVDGIG